MDANLPAAHWDLADAYVQKKMYPEAAAEWQGALTVSGDSKLAATLGEAYRLSGFQGVLRTWAEYDSKNAMSGFRPYEGARRFVLLGKKKEALDWLRKSLPESYGGEI